MSLNASELIEILCECQRNIDSAKVSITDAKFDVAASKLEVAASKLRVLQDEKDTISIQPINKGDYVNA